MSATTSAATGRCFGIQRVCQVWERSRSALYARRARARVGAVPARGGRGRGNRTRSCWRRFGPISRGPRSTAKAIARSTPGFGSWTGSESPARGCCASCGRTDCSPRTAGVKAPRRPATGGSSPSAPNVMWGTDGVRVVRRRVGLDRGRTLERGVSKVGSRFAALDDCGSLDADVERFGWSPCQTTSSSKSGIGGSTPASALSRNRKRTGWRSGGIARSRSKRSTAESFSAGGAAVADFGGTTRPGVSRSSNADRGARGVCATTA